MPTGEGDWLMATVATEEQYAEWAAMCGLPTAPTGLDVALTRATAELVSFCGRPLTPSPEAEDETETRIVVGGGGYTLAIPDALSVVSATAEGRDVGTFATVGTPIAALRLLNGKQWPRCQITVTGRFGLAEQENMPEPLVEACCILAAVRLVPGSASWSQWGVTKTSVLGVTVEMEEPGKQVAARRKEAFDLAGPYRRLW